MRQERSPAVMEAKGVEALAAVRPGWRRPSCPSARFAVLAALLAVLPNNGRLFGLLIERGAGAAGVLAAAAALTGLVGAFLLAAGAGRALKPLAVATLVVAAGLGYFTQAFGTVFDVDMIRNVAEAAADRNAMEAAELLSFALAGHLLLHAGLPALLLFWIRVAPAPLRAELRARALHAAGLAALVALLLGANFRHLTYFARENADLRSFATPTYAVASLVKYAGRTWLHGRSTFTELGRDAVRRKSVAGRVVGVLVVGETARADHFGINGYRRPTTPCLARRPLINFPDARSAGTSTAYSVPFMFSFLGRDGYTPEKARRQSNVLDVLSRAGVRVVWIENNSGHKGVAERMELVETRSPTGTAYDEALVGEVERRLEASSGDVLFVLHTIGSHGPAYHRRYPPAFERFTPACRQETPQNATREEVENAYDNTIAYTDYVLDRLIAALEARGEDVSFLLYASDHGESLGEGGIYLHGLPAVLAPAAQTHVPLFAWLSPRLVAERAVPVEALRAGAGARRTHESLPHTLLGLFEVRTSLYRPALDLLQVP